MAGDSVPTLVPGLGTGIGSLPHVDARAAAAMSLRCTPRLPAAPQLPARAPAEGMIAQWVDPLPEIDVQPDGTLLLRASPRGDEPLRPRPGPEGHAGLLAFLDAASDARSSRVKLQLTGPLTIGVALCRAGMTPSRAFARAGELVRAWIGSLETLVEERLPGAAVMVFLDEPGLVAWHRGEEPITRERATDLLSGTLAAARGVAGVHVCGDGDHRIALEAGPKVMSAEVTSRLIADAGPIARHLDADGWIAWGAVPTDRPVGESAEPLWRQMASVWCELTRRGCDPARMRAQALVTPACGLAGHGPSQAERALRLAVELGCRVHDQAVATRLTLGA